MRYVATLILAAVLLMLSIARVSPATQPAGPATQPTCDVYLTPFTALGGDNSLDWAGKAVSQNLLTDLARAKFHPLAADKPFAATSDAQAAAKSVGAKWVIVGTYQTAELQVRFNGQIIDVGNGNVLGGVSATGSPRDLFALEDSLSAQAIAQLNQIPTPASNKPAGPLPPALQPAVVVQVIQPPAVAAPGVASSYQGSALQDYVESNRTPSTDYSQQVQDAHDRANTGIYNSGYGGFGSFGGGYGGFGGYYSPYIGGYGLGFYSGNAGGFGFGSGYAHHSGGHGSRGER